MIDRQACKIAVVGARSVGAAVATRLIETGQTGADATKILIDVRGRARRARSRRKDAPARRHPA
ncbi:hypothetical protein LJR255_003901 [Pararhizobium sp. LjRoot255]|uniref:hypothetical protein n=1 Tax=Pararhizobium sp. LjRoot255 TaxID=3342298 RepID=UPI003ECF11F7